MKIQCSHLAFQFLVSSYHTPRVHMASGPLRWRRLTHPAEFVLSFRASVHEGLGNDRQRGVHHLGRVDVEDEVWVLQDVHPEPQGQAVDTSTLSASPSVFT